MRFTWLSNAPWTHTGYGVQTGLFMDKFVEMGHEPAVIAFFGLDGALLATKKYPIYPKGFDQFGNDVVRAHTIKHNAQVCFSLLDSWVINPASFGDDVKWVPWFPIDSEPCPRPVLENVSQAWRRIAMSKFGVKMLENAGLDCYYVPHAVDTEKYKPYDRYEHREKYGLPKDAYVIGMVAANKGFPSRKAFTPQIMAFAEFHKRHTDAVLYLHTSTSEHGEFGGVNLIEFCEFCGLEIGKNVFFPNQYDLMMGFYNPTSMAQIYSSMDVHMLVSMGEGFGIPILEAQACGCPVITSGWTANEELCFSGRTVDKKDADPWYTPQAAFQYKPRIRAIELALEAERRKPSSREKAREMALAYDVNAVCENYWKPVFEDIESRLDNNGTSKTHQHRWAKVGLWEKNGDFIAPCKDKNCPAELRIKKNGVQSISPTGFEPVIGGVDMDIEDDPEGGVAKVVMREIRNDYDLDIPFEDGDIVLDIGAHVGIVSIYLAKKHPNITIYAFEPYKPNYERLLRNIIANKVKNVIPFNRAVTADGRDVMIGGDPKTNTGGANIFVERGEAVQSIKVGDFLKEKNVERVKLLKIDCEGAEYEILENADWLDRVEYVRGEFHSFGKRSMDDLVALVTQHVKPENVKLTLLKDR